MTQKTAAAMPTGDALIIIDAQQNVCSWSPAAEVLFGYSETEARRLRLTNLVAEEAEQRALQQALDALLNDQQRHQVIALNGQTQNGEHFAAEFNLSLFQQQDQTLVIAQVRSTDLWGQTSCTRIDALEVKEGSLEIPLNAALAIINGYLLNPLLTKGAILVSDRSGPFSLRASLNLQPDEQTRLVAHDWTDCHSGEEQPLSLSCGGIEGCLCLPLRDKKRRLQGILCLIADPSAQNAEAMIEPLQQIALSLAQLIERYKLFRQNRRLRQILEQNPVAIGITDTDANFEYANRQLCQVSGYSAHELIGQNARMLGSGDTPDELYQNLWATIRSGKEWRGELKNQKKDGSLFWESELILPIFEDHEIVNFVVIKEDITEKKYHQEQLLNLSTHDLLTDLPNEQLLRDRIIQALAIAERGGKPQYLCVLDIKQMRLINESHGLATGDALLVEVAMRLKKLFRKEDSIARLSSDAFALICHTDAPDKIAIKLDTLCATPFITPASEFEIGITAAFIEFPRHGSDPETLLRRATATLHHAKIKGLKAPLHYDESLDKLAFKQISLKKELQQALLNNEFELWYQPKVHSGTGKVIGAEALIRWRHPLRGIVPPLEFISVAETTGLIIEMGLWVIETVVAQVKAWSESELFMQPVSFNVSPRQFADPRLLDTLRNSINKHRLDPRLLEMELTESVLVDDPLAVRAILNEVAQLGVNIALDDFGTGYSSLAYIHKLPIHLVKIDKSFIQGVMTNQQDVVIVKSTLSMCRDLGLKIIAEGVETPGQCAFLARNGCYGIQGFLFSKPLPASEFISRIHEGFTSAADGPDNLKTLIVLDDEQSVLNAIRRSLRRSGYQLLLTTDPDEALGWLASYDVGVVITDQRMPTISGTEFLRKIKNAYPNTSRMVLSGYSEFSSITRAINDGAIFRYLSKPWDDDDLVASIEDGFYYFNLRKSLLKKEQQLDRIIKSSQLSLKGLEMGISWVDSEHAELIDLHNLLCDAYFADADKADLLQMASRFVEHCRSHFDHEELLMKDLDYPDSESHIKAHGLMMGILEGSYLLLQQNDDNSNLYGLINQITRSIIDHIREYDLPLAEYYHLEKPKC